MKWEYYDDLFSQGTFNNTELDKGFLKLKKDYILKLERPRKGNDRRAIIIYPFAKFNRYYATCFQPNEDLKFDRIDLIFKAESVDTTSPLVVDIRLDNGNNEPGIFIYSASKTHEIPPGWTLSWYSFEFDKTITFKAGTKYWILVYFNIDEVENTDDKNIEIFWADRTTTEPLNILYCDRDNWEIFTDPYINPTFAIRYYKYEYITSGYWESPILNNENGFGMISFNPISTKQPYGTTVIAKPYYSDNGTDWIEGAEYSEFFIIPSDKRDYPYLKLRLTLTGTATLSPIVGYISIDTDISGYKIIPNIIDNDVITQIKILGEKFSQTAKVIIADYELTPTMISETELRCYIPPYLQGGIYPLYVKQIGELYIGELEINDRTKHLYIQEEDTIKKSEILPYDKVTFYRLIGKRFPLTELEFSKTLEVPDTTKIRDNWKHYDNEIRTENIDYDLKNVGTIDFPDYVASKVRLELYDVTSQLEEFQKPLEQANNYWTCQLSVNPINPSLQTENYAVTETEDYYIFYYKNCGIISVISKFDLKTKYYSEGQTDSYHTVYPILPAGSKQVFGLRGDNIYFTVADAEGIALYQLDFRNDKVLAIEKIFTGFEGYNVGWITCLPVTYYNVEKYQFDMPESIILAYYSQPDSSYRLNKYVKLKKNEPFKKILSFSNSNLNKIITLESEGAISYWFIGDNGTFIEYIDRFRKYETGIKENIYDYSFGLSLYICSQGKLYKKTEEQFVPVESGTSNDLYSYISFIEEYYIIGDKIILKSLDGENWITKQVLLQTYYSAVQIDSIMQLIAVGKNGYVCYGKVTETLTESQDFPYTLNDIKKVTLNLVNIFAIVGDNGKFYICKEGSPNPYPFAWTVEVDLGTIENLNGIEISNHKFVNPYYKFLIRISGDNGFLKSYYITINNNDQTYTKFEFNLNTEYLDNLNSSIGNFAVGDNGTILKRNYELSEIADFKKPPVVDTWGTYFELPNYFNNRNLPFALNFMNDTNPGLQEERGQVICMYDTEIYDSPLPVNLKEDLRKPPYIIGDSEALITGWVDRYITINLNIKGNEISCSGGYVSWWIIPAFSGTYILDLGEDGPFYFDGEVMRLYKLVDNAQHDSYHYWGVEVLSDRGFNMAPAWMEDYSYPDGNTNYEIYIPIYLRNLPHEFTIYDIPSIDMNYLLTFYNDEEEVFSFSSNWQESNTEYRWFHNRIEQKYWEITKLNYTINYRNSFFGKKNAKFLYSKTNLIDDKAPIMCLHCRVPNWKLLELFPDVEVGNPNVDCLGICDDFALFVYQKTTDPYLARFVGINKDYKSIFNVYIDNIIGWGFLYYGYWMGKFTIIARDITGGLKNYVIEVSIDGPKIVRTIENIINLSYAGDNIGAGDRRAISQTIYTIPGNMIKYINDLYGEDYNYPYIYGYFPIYKRLGEFVSIILLKLPENSSFIWTWLNRIAEYFPRSTLQFKIEDIDLNQNYIGYLPDELVITMIFRTQDIWETEKVERIKFKVELYKTEEKGLLTPTEVKALDYSFDYSLGEGAKSLALTLPNPDEQYSPLTKNEINYVNDNFDPLVSIYNYVKIEQGVQDRINKLIKKRSKFFGMIDGFEYGFENGLSFIRVNAKDMLKTLLDTTIDNYHYVPDFISITDDPIDTLKDDDPQTTLPVVDSLAETVRYAHYDNEGYRITGWKEGSVKIYIAKFNRFEEYTYEELLEDEIIKGLVDMTDGIVSIYPKWEMKTKTYDHLHERTKCDLTPYTSLCFYPYGHPEQQFKTPEYMAKHSFIYIDGVKLPDSAEITFTRDNYVEIKYYDGTEYKDYRKNKVEIVCPIRFKVTFDYYDYTANESQAEYLIIQLLKIANSLGGPGLIDEDISEEREYDYFYTITGTDRNKKWYCPYNNWKNPPLQYSKREPGQDSFSVVVPDNKNEKEGWIYFDTALPEGAQVKCSRYNYWTIQNTGIALTESNFNLRTTENTYNAIMEQIKEKLPPNYNIYYDDETEKYRGEYIYQKSSEDYEVKNLTQLSLNEDDTELFTRVVAIGIKPKEEIKNIVKAGTKNMTLEIKNSHLYDIHGDINRFVDGDPKTKIKFITKPWALRNAPLDVILFTLPDNPESGKSYNLGQINIMGGEASFKYSLYINKTDANGDPLPIEFEAIGPTSWWGQNREQAKDDTITALCAKALNIQSKDKEIKTFTYNDFGEFLPVKQILIRIESWELIGHFSLTGLQMKIGFREMEAFPRETIVASAVLQDTDPTDLLYNPELLRKVGYKTKILTEDAGLKTYADTLNRAKNYLIYASRSYRQISLTVKWNPCLIPGQTIRIGDSKYLIQRISIDKSGIDPTITIEGQKYD